MTKSITVKNLSSALLFADDVDVVEIRVGDYDAYVLPNLDLFTPAQVETIVPLQRIPEDDAERIGMLHTWLESEIDLFEPAGERGIVLPDLAMSPEDAQAMLLYINSPCGIIYLDDDVVLTMPENSEASRRALITALLLLGYFPPMFLQELPRVSCTNPYLYCQAFVQRHVEGIAFLHNRMMELLG